MHLLSAGWSGVEKMRIELVNQWRKQKTVRTEWNLLVLMSFGS
jgi:hypothetical protein